MKDWIFKHPILTFLLVDSAIGGTVSIIRSVASIFTQKTEKVEEVTVTSESTEEE